MLEASFMAFRMLPEKAEGMRPAMLSGLGRGLGRSTSGSSSLMEKNCPHPTTLHDPGLNCNNSSKGQACELVPCHLEGCCTNRLHEGQLELICSTHRYPHHPHLVIAPTMRPSCMSS